MGPQPNSSFPYDPLLILRSKVAWDWGSIECHYQLASFYYDLTAATSEAHQLGAILKLAPVP